MKNRSGGILSMSMLFLATIAGAAPAHKFIATGDGVAVAEAKSDSLVAEAGAPQRLGYLEDFLLEEEPVILWKHVQKATNTRGRPHLPGVSHAVVANGVVFIGDDDGVLRAFRSHDGKLLWEHNHGSRIFNAPTADCERVYFSTDAGVVALSAATGQVAWNDETADAARTVSWPGRAPKANKIHTLFFSGENGLAYALDARNGNGKWTASLMGDVIEPLGFGGDRGRFPNKQARPTGISTDGKLLVQSVFDQSRIVAIDARTGIRLWTFQSEGWIWGAATIGENEVFIGSQDKKFYCLDKASGEVKWSYTTGGRIESVASIQNDDVFITSCDGNMYCLHRIDGTLKWKSATEPNEAGNKAIYTHPLVTKRSVFFAAGPGYVYALDRKTGEQRWRIQPDENSDLYTDVVTDGKRPFVTSRPQQKKPGVSALFAIGLK
jgi:outer membrane protein assembly factor BamB